MRKLLNALIVCSVLLCLGFFVGFKLTSNAVLQSLYITFLTFSYHFIMRFVMGRLPIFKSDFDYNAKWFQPKWFEKKLYKFLEVKKWKSHIPAYYPDAFDSRYHSLEEIAKAMCNAEVVHERIAVFSFVPILFSIKYGVPLVFIFTSIFGCLFDLVFVAVQRYNRPRIVKLIEKEKRK